MGGSPLLRWWASSDQPLSLSFVLNTVRILFRTRVKNERIKVDNLITGPILQFQSSACELAHRVYGHPGRAYRVNN